jgi:hypothetical protein
MCFSATASFVAGTGLSALGIATLKKVKSKNELAFAAIPLMFGLQQFAEGVLWLTFTMEAPTLHAFMTYAFTGFSRVLWPLFVPLAVLALEPTPWRRRALMGLEVAGMVAAAYLLYYILLTPMSAEVVGHHIVYVSPHLNPGPILILYLAATCASSLFSSHKYIKIFGVLSLVGFAGAAAVSTVALFSVWCFFAALISSVVYVQTGRKTAL